MGDLNRVVGDIVRLLIRLGAAILSAVEAIEVTLREELAVNGVPPFVQTLILLLLGFALVVLAVRVFGGLLRWAVIVILLLLAVHLLLPTLMLPSY